MSMNPHERPEPILRYFGYHHLPAKSQKVAKPFSDLAHLLVDTLPPSPERTVSLRKLLEGQDAAVRAMQPDSPAPYSG